MFLFRKQVRLRGAHVHTFLLRDDVSFDQVVFLFEVLDTGEILTKRTIFTSAINQGL